MNRSPAIHRRAFSLIELLVVILIIGVLITLALPALSNARRAARSTAGVANMRSTGQAMSVYTNDHREGCLTAFRKREPNEPGGHGAMWWDAVSSSDPTLFWRFQSADVKWHTDFFTYYWYSFLADYHGTLRFREEQISPADGPLRAIIQTEAGDDRYSPRVLWASSFMYSPTFWFDPLRFAYAGIGVTPELLRANSLANVSFPASKVMIWQRADFQSVRGDGAAHPWISPRATTWVFTADGSVASIKMSDLYSAAAENSAFAPVKVIVPPRVVSGQRPTTDVGPVADVPEQGGPAFFWATRNGIEGRDLPGR